MSDASNKSSGLTSDWSIWRDAIYAIIIVGIAILALMWFTSNGGIQSDEAAAIGNMRTINGAEEAYYKAMGAYTGSFRDLCTPPKDLPPFINWDEKIQADGSVITSGYRITLFASEDGQSYKVVAIPTRKVKTGEREIMVDTSGIIQDRENSAEDWGLVGRPGSYPIGE